MMPPDETGELRTRDPVEQAVHHWAERYPDAGSSGFRALTTLIRTYGLVTRNIEGLLRPVELNLSRFEVLLLLSFTRTGCLPIMRLRDLLMIHGSSVTYLVDRLEEAGWVAREADPSDRRVSLVRLTPEGREVIDAAAGMLVEADFGALAALEDDRRGLFCDLLDELRQESEAPAEPRA